MRISLTLKTRWFDMIESGYKKEEYRDITPHWQKRIGQRMNEITEVYFTNFRKEMVFKVDKITIGTPKRKWTERPDRVCYILHLGERIQ